MAEKELKYREVWRCMLCGEKMYGKERKRSELSTNIVGYKLHGCKDGSYGTGELIGFEKRNN